MTVLIEHASIVAFQGPGRSAVHPLLEKAHRRTFLALTDEMLILRHFGGLYFSYQQAVHLDSLLVAAHSEKDDLRDCFLAAIVSTASEIVNTVGKHLAQPIRPRGSDGKPQGRGKTLNVVDTYISFASLNRTDIGAMQSAQIS